MIFWKYITLGIFVTALFCFWFFMIGFSSNKDGSFFNKGHNAIWIGHEWVGQAKSNTAVQQLVNTFKDNDIDTVFVHVGPIGEDGKIDGEVYRYAENFLEQARKFDKDIKYQAWMGQIRKKLDLSDVAIRKKVVDTSIIMAQVVGFDGIHLDVEPVWDEDTDFVKLVEEVRAALPEEKKISVALAEYIPRTFVWLTDQILHLENYNTEINYRNIAEHADQIVVMVYDTSIEDKWLYSWLVQEETIRVTSMLDDKEVFIAIPSYEEEKPGFNPSVENIETGLQGIIKGLNNFRGDENNFAGVAIYSQWETDDDEWEIYKKLWLND